MMTIKQFEQATRLKRSTIRFYEEKGLLKPEARGNGYRLYDRSHLETVEAIRLGQMLGFSISEIGDLIAAWSGNRLSPADKRRAIEKKHRECLAKRDQLNQLIGYLHRTLAWMDEGAAGDKPAFKSGADTSST